MTSVCEDDICQINLNYLLSYQELTNELSKLSDEEYFEIDYFETDEIEAFNNISNDYWNESKDRLKIYVDFGILEYLEAKKSLEILEYSLDTDTIETKVRFPSDEEKEKFCESINSNIDDLLAIYIIMNINFKGDLINGINTVS